jgi:replication-associated recombination protein RarA
MTEFLLERAAADKRLRTESAKMKFFKSIAAYILYDHKTRGDARENVNTVELGYNVMKGTEYFVSL